MNIIKADEQSIWSPPASVEAQPFHWLPYFVGFLRRRWPLMAACVLGCMVLAAGFALTATPKFTAGAQLLVDIRRADLLSQQHEIQDSLTLNSVLESQVEILRSEGLARKVVERLKLLDDKQFNANTFSLTNWVRSRLARVAPKAFTTGGGDREGAAAQRLMQMTSVRRIGLTYVIQIDVTSTSAIESARLANGLIDAYIVGQLEVQDDTTRQAGTWMQERLKELRDQALEAGIAVEQYKAAKDIVSTDKGLMNEQQLAELNSELVSARAATSQAKARLDQIHAVLQEDIAHTGIGDKLSSPVIDGLRTKFLDDSEREAVWSARYGSNNGQVVKLREEMAQIQQSVRSELERIAASYESDYEIARSDEAAVAGRLRGLVSLTVKTNGDRVELASLQSSAETYRSVYENFLTRYTQAVQDESFPISEARVITAATPPLKKSAPQTTILVVVAAVLGFCLGFILAFVRETLDRRVRTISQLRAATGLRCLGMLPRLRTLRRRGKARAISALATRSLSTRHRGLRATADDPESDFAQATRALRVRLSRDNQRSRAIRSIGFISASRGEGSSTVAANFAQSLAKMGHRTVLLDWNFDDDSLSRALAPNCREGFLDALADGPLLGDLLWRDPDTGLDFLPAGSHSRLAPMLLGSPRAQTLLGTLQANHDYVVVDLPPVSPVVETHTAANCLDACVLVVEWGQARQDALVESLLRAGLDDTRFVGAVFNQVDFKALRKYSDGALEYARTAWA